MIVHCPFCGQVLQEALYNGVSFCQHYNRVFRSCPDNVLLSAAWMLKKHPSGLDKFISDSRLPEHDASFVYDLIMDAGLSIE